MPWSEEQRVVSQEAAELLAIANAQPACKKRLIATGEGEEQRSDEKEIIETVIGKEEAEQLEEGRRSLKLPRVRRHSSFMPGSWYTPRILRRSRSFAPESDNIDYVQDQQKAVANDLLNSFLDIHDSLPAYRDRRKSIAKRPTSEIARMVANHPAGARSRTRLLHNGRNPLAMVKGKAQDPANQQGWKQNAEQKFKPKSQIAMAD